MVKGVERGVTISAVRLLTKSGGKSGEWVRPDGGEPAAPGRRPGDRSAGRIARGPRPSPRPGGRRSG
jgi:hypothetical protein